MTKNVSLTTLGAILILGCASGTQQNSAATAEEPETGQEAESQPEPSVEQGKEPHSGPAAGQTPEPASEGDFAFAFYRQLATKQGNLFFSPYSLQVALAMTYGGARGDTEKQMRTALSFPASQDELHKEMFQAQAGLNNTEGIELSVANSLWPAKKFPFKNEYLKLIEEKYSAQITALDFAQNPEKARQTINKWVSDKTNKKIKKLIDKGFIDSLTTLILTNAIYFKGTWNHPFDPKDTKDVEFNVGAGQVVKAPMMGRTTEFNFYQDDQLQILEMPYTGGEVSMFAVLPRNADDLGSIESEINEAKISKWLESMHRIRVHVLFPKFKYQSAFELKKELAALGMTDAFDGNKADFTGMAEPKDAVGLFISAVLHKAMVDVNEEGTEAAAATAVLVKRGGMPMRFIADHPFLFFIREKKTGTVLFVGRMTNPLA